jgi:hypothetical protein
MTLCPEDFLSGEWTPRFGGARLWMAARDLILARDGYVCQISGGSCGQVATQADHIVPVSAGGTDQASNLQAACGPCNKLKGSASRRSQEQANCGCVVGRDDAGRLAWIVECGPDCEVPPFMWRMFGHAQ